MEIDSHTLLSLLAFLGSTAATVIGFFMSRTLHSVDEAVKGAREEIKEVRSEIKELADADTALKVQIADLLARVRALENGGHNGRE
jgi:septal ring factor EnvC (AmiA/AmiB activator)